MEKHVRREKEHIIIMNKIILLIKLKLILVIGLTIALTSCTEKLNNKEYNFVTGISEIDGECLKKLKKIITPLYIYEDSRDSIISINLLDARLFDKHYSDEENDRFLFFSTTIYQEQKDSVINYFFGVDKKHSELVFLNFLVEYDILTIDFHEKVGEDFTFLNECIPKSINRKNISKKPIYYQNKTFDLSTNNVWVVDSISGGNEVNSPFYDIDTFSIINNEYIKHKKDSIRFEFKDYSLFIGNSKNKVVSSSYNYKIIYNSKGGFVFVKKVRDF